MGWGFVDIRWGGGRGVGVGQKIESPDFRYSEVIVISAMEIF